MTATTLRNTALEQVSDHNPRWKERALRELGWFRSARLKINPEAVFIWEEILPDLERLCGKIPNFNLSGAVVMDAIRSGFIEPTGRYRHTTGDAKHSRKAAEYKWKDKT